MSISLPTYSRLELPLLGRQERVRAIIATGLRREFRRPAAIVVTVIGAAFTTITSTALIRMYVTNAARTVTPSNTPSAASQSIAEGVAPNATFATAT